MADPTDDRERSALAALERLTDEELRLLRRLITALSSAEVIRTKRLEVVDDAGRPRVVIGNLARDEEEGDCFPGISLRAGDGSLRAELAVTDDGPVLTFTFRGYDAFVAGVDDPVPGVARGGPYLELLDRPGHVAVGWRLADEEIIEWKEPAAG